MVYQSLVVLSGQGYDATLHRVAGLFDADVDHIREVTVHLELLQERHNTYSTTVRECLCVCPSTKQWPTGGAVALLLNAYF